MVIAALVSFGALFVAWILAPDEAASRPKAVVHDSEALPIAA
jgi:hypothetical protein